MMLGFFSVFEMLMGDFGRERGLLNCISMVYPVCYTIEEFVTRRRKLEIK